MSNEILVGRDSVEPTNVGAEFFGSAERRPTGAKT
jgi:hypothetical protein